MSTPTPRQCNEYDWEDGVQYRCALERGHDGTHRMVYEPESARFFEQIRDARSDPWHSTVVPGVAATRTSTGIRFPADLHAALVAAAEERGLTLNWLVVQLCKEGVARLLPPEELRLTREATR